MRNTSRSALIGLLAFASLGWVAVGCGGSSSKSSTSSTSTGTVIPSPQTNPSQPASPVTTTGSAQTKTNPSPPVFPSPTPSTSPGASPSPTPNSGHLYSVNENSNNISVFTYSATTGDLSAGADTAIPASLVGPYWAALDSTTASSVLFVTITGTTALPEGHLLPFGVNTTTGALTVGTAVATAGLSPFGLAVDGTNKLVYTSDATNGTGAAPGDVSSFSYVAGGALTALTPASKTAGTKPFTVVLNPTGTILYVGNEGSNSIQSFPLTTGVLGTATTLTPIAASGGPFVLVLDPTGNLLFCGNGDGTVTSLKLTAGQLPATAPTGVAATGIGTASVYGIAVDPTSKFLVTVNVDSASATTSGDLGYFSINGTTGALTQIGAFISPSSATALPSDVAIEPTGTFAYVTEQVVEKIAVYKLSATALTPTANSPFSYPAAGDSGPTRVLIGN